MNLQKRECPIKMRLVPYGGGWTDVYADFGDGELYFIISHCVGDDFDTLMSALYHLYPNQTDYDHAEELVEYKTGICELVDDGYIVKEIIDDPREHEMPYVSRDIPWKAEFDWDEEGAGSHWLIERIPDVNKEFTIKISIDINRADSKHYEYELSYSDMCYAVAEACTKALKKHGVLGYYHSIYHPDMNIRYLLFLKSIALNNSEAIELTYYDEKGHGETTDFQKEVELLLFDM
jgi:hypothetical protein